MQQPIEDFLSLVLPHQGTKVLVEIAGDTIRNHTYDEGTSNAEIAHDVRTIDAKGSTVYMAMSGYAPQTVSRYKGRTKENAKWVRSLWVDLDVGESKDYATIQEAASELVRVVNAARLPAPTLVHSGYGLHVYWPLADDLPIDAWRPAAAQMQALLQSHGLRMDTHCTTDAARILRPIGSHNYKAEPRAVRLIQSSGAVPFTEVQRYLAALPAPMLSRAAAPVKINGNHADAFGLGSIDKVRPEDFSAKKIVAGCAQFAWAMKHQDQVKEPLWRAMIGTLYRTDNPAMIHAFSNQHPGYTSEETEAKAQAWVGGGVTCAMVEQLRPGGCVGCAKYGVIKSPSWFGLKQSQQELPPAVIDAATGMPENWVLRGGALFVRSDDGLQLLYNGRIEFGQPFKERDPTSKNDIQFLPLRARTAMDEHEMYLHMGAHASLQELKKAFTSVGILPETRLEKEFINGMRAWIQKITDESTSVKPVRQMGWQSHEASDTQAGFVLGTTLYTPGKKQTVRIDAAAEKHSRHMKQEGTLDEWKQAINIYSRREYASYALMSWLMFGAPLGRLLGMGLPIAHFNSQGSGHGKTGTQDLLLSGAGNPRDPNGRWTGNTTLISIYAYLTAMNGNIAVLDETSAIPPETLGKLMFEATLGSGRKAMQGSSGQTRDLPPITGLLCTSGNVSLQQLAQTLKGNSEAQVARVFEFNVRRPELTDAQRYADAETFKKVYENYGHAMPVFIEYVVNHQALVKVQMAEIERKLITKLGMNNEERFWRALLTVCITGALIAKRLGLIDHDVNALLPAALRHFYYQRAAMAESAQDNVLYQFVQDNQQSVLVVDTDKPTVTATGMQIVTAIRRPAAHVNVRMRYVVDTGRLYVDRKYLRAYCSEKNFDFRQMLTDAANGGWLLSDQERRDLAVFTNLDTPARVMCVVFDMIKAKSVVDLLIKETQ